MSDNITFQVETEINNFEELGSAHFNEVDNRSSIQDFDLDFENLKQLIDLGFLYVVSVKDKDKAIGYYACTVTENFATKKPNAKEMAIYIDPEYRGKGICKGLFGFVEDLMRSVGVEFMYTTFKHNHNSELPLKLGYKLSEVTYEKYIG